jgi:hypothetical protein
MPMPLQDNPYLPRPTEWSVDWFARLPLQIEPYIKTKTPKYGNRLCLAGMLVNTVLKYLEVSSEMRYHERI